MKTMMFAARPNLMQEKCPAHLDPAMQIVRDASLFTPRRPNQRPQLRLKERLLPFPGLEQNN